jgi:hypothetical protein
LSVLFHESVGAPGAFDGATISLWDPDAQNFLTHSIYSQISGWSINYVMMPGFGALLHSPAPFQITFFGEIPGYVNYEIVPRTPPPDGVRLLSSLLPYMSATFTQAIGRDPREGESVTSLDNATGNYSSTTFQGGAWNNGEPRVPLVGSAFYNLGPVPEPTTMSLGLLGLGIVVLCRRAFSCGRTR